MRAGFVVACFSMVNKLKLELQLAMRAGCLSAVFLTGNKLKLELQLAVRAACLIALLGGFSWAATAAEQEFPYTAYVVTRETMARSAPGRNYYATEKLDQGAKIEVYRHEGDWCGIRPPAESFSWVRADDLRVGHDGVGVVTKEGAPSWVGSHVNEFRDVIQVRLERGEEVEVLDAIQLGDHGGNEFYCKIAPPSGEFRWIHKDEISREMPDTDSDPEDVPRRRRSTVSSRASGWEERAASRRESGHWGSWVRSRGSEAAGASDANDGSGRRWLLDEVRDRSVTLASGEGYRSDERHGASGHQRSDAVAEVANDGVSGSLEDDLNDIDLELSRIVVERPARWNFEALRKKIETARVTANTSDERSKVRALQDKIAKFEDIRQRSVSLGMPGDAAGAGLAAGRAESGRSVFDSGPMATALEGRRTEESGGDRYDGVGKLTRVVSQRPNAPRYALVDKGDEVVSFVSPAPGVNLQSFEGQYVGISGQRGYMPELKKPHVTAQRVSPVQVGQAREIPWRR
jgi:hypothetical protein